MVRRAAGVLFWCLAATCVHGQGRAPAPSAPSQQLITLDVIVNGTKSGVWPFVERAGALHAPREALDEWRVKIPSNSQPISVRGTEYWPLAGIPGFTSTITQASQTLEISFAADVFAPTQLSGDTAPRPKISPVLTSAFLNYELYYARSQGAGVGSSDVGALAELGYSTGLGVLTSSHAGRNLAATTADLTPTWVRLETTFTRDIPDSNLTLRLGDAATRAGTWGRSVYFGGVQWGTNFSLTPGFLSQPIPVVSGSSAAASTVELYVNGVLRQVSQVPAGPFALDNGALLTGNGEARLVVRDILGRETVIVQPFFTSAQLLAKGLDDWSVEAGSLRRELGVANARYGSGFLSGTWRRGLTDGFTLEGRSELTAHNQTTGLAAVSTLPGQVLGKTSLVASRHELAGLGRQWMVGAERQWLQSSIVVQAQGASRGFRQLGDGDTLAQVRLQLAGNLAYSTDSSGSFGVGFASIERYGAERVTTVSANYSVRVGKQSSLSAYVSHALAGGTGTAVGFSLSIPLEHGRQIGSSVTRRGGVTDAYLTASQFPLEETGLGWRVLGGQLQADPHAEAGLYYTGQRGRLSADISAGPRQSALRAGASGGIVLVDGHVFATRTVDQSFAIAEVEGYGDVGIGLGSNVLSRTDTAGIALIPRLTPYQENAVRIDPRELPVNAEIESLEQVVVPAFRSAVKATFPVRSGRGALIKFTLDDGEVAPAGAVVSIVGDTQEFYIARRGEAFVTGLKPENRLRLRWKEQGCTIDVVLPAAANDEIARLGPVQCKGVKR
jgi:outer membrane usher protein